MAPPPQDDERPVVAPRPSPSSEPSTPASPPPRRPSRPVRRTPAPAPAAVAEFPPAGEPPATRRDASMWLLLALVGFIVGQVAALIFIEIVAGALGKTSSLSAIGRLSVPPEWYVITSLVGLWVGFFGAPWLASRVRGTGHLVRDFGIRFKVVDLWGILIGVGGQILVGILYAPFINHLHNFSAPTKRLTGDAHGWGFVLIGVFTVVGAPFMEELFFRGLVLRGLGRVFTGWGAARGRRPWIGLVLALFVDGVLFALAHAEWEQFAGLALFGMLLAYIAYRTDRLGMNMVAHASFNLVALIAVIGTTH